MLARVADALAEREVSVARLLQHQNGDGAALHVVTHETRQGALDDALAAITAMDEVRAQAAAVPRRLRARRRGARMGVIERYRDRLPVGAATPDADARRGLDAADPARGGSASGSASSCTSSSRA